jgi:hypothetical protein
MKTKDASFQSLIDMCDKVGWDKGIKKLEHILNCNENAYAFLIASDYYEQKKARTK